MIILTLVVCFLLSIFITPMIKKLAFKIGATDKPNQRKVHHHLMPRLGGLAIYVSFVVGVMLTKPQNWYYMPILAGSSIIIITGVLDDVFQISAKLKLLGQLVASLIVVLIGGLHVVFINLPFGGHFEFGFLSIPFTIIWIIGITNAINLIDGLDGLAAGVSSIALSTIAGIALLQGNIFVFTISVIVVASTLGFLVFNFHPARIFMGDTGALFLGYIISVLSLLGFKNITFISFVVPVIILGVPISDTIFAIVRRLINSQPLTTPDKSHLHHCILRLGYSHRQTVLIIYGLSALFSISAVALSQLNFKGSFLLIGTLVLLIELFAEKIDLVGKDYKPLLKIIRILRLDKNR
ncbi:glycosyltransferase family 4 protein [Neobacillus terrae]|uniref:glycosyltransferase family 4 protein n=1 Tax=Neobacillus terrae TaxID=3034837 RepID=UPI00140AC576|nr:MraY family glycosyltransferase [Neobacillus terrae]NHM29979.1 undecaprenyl/decaprenyl-phosphate alpha-N-acetylglucosaminyl 1-phosphate transferase [Neobacillus terrae]